MKAGGPKFSGLFKGTKLLFDDDFLQMVGNSCWYSDPFFDSDGMKMKYEKNRCLKFENNGSKI